MGEGRDHDDELRGLMTRLAAGDRAAFTPVYEALWPLCVSRAQRLTRDTALAEDAAQRALLKLFAQAASFDARRSAVGWALTLTDWEARTSARQLQRRRESAVDTAALDDGTALERDVERRDLTRRLASVATHLSGAERMTLAACLDDERGPGDAAFRKRKQRLVERLRHLFRSEP